ncbi:phage holin family protein [Anaeromassilibacillus senegalensis]|uniref:phage holin family protein n=1 Tax=Anaeromassilibacillus senegalensis TaxID=1673717 RepID=UPI00067FA7B2|nr:phage holin family protein [Anaeromassilibacillus senegalensis]
MNEHIVIGIKATITAACAALSAWLGWFGWLVIAWAACMVVDYITGSAAACRAGEWSSAVARDGIWHKTGAIVAVVAAVLTDWMIGLVVNNIPAVILPWDYTVLLCPVVLAWYILTELGSIVENAGKLGAPVPAFLARIIAACKGSVDAAGDKLAGGDSDNKEDQ